MPRKYTRLHIPLEIVIDFSSGRREARVSDLSMGGCFVDSIISVTDGDTIAFELLLSNNEQMKLTGEVVYSMPNIGFGIRFNDLTEEQEFQLELLILKHGGSIKPTSE